MSKLRSQIRAKLQRQSIQVYSICVCEPQHDGTPHWHLLLFTGAPHVEEAGAILRNYALREDGDEGVDKRRLVVNVEEAGIVRRIFEGFSRVRSTTEMARILAAEGITTKVWATRDGNSTRKPAGNDKTGKLRRKLRS